MDTIGTKKDGENHCTEAPKWLDILENRRKRPHRLAHDIGAGSPCLVCKEKCKGLNLHFWRKICIECKCRKEDHDFVDEDEYVQMEILFGAKKVKKTTLRHNALNKTFDWVPQNVSQELVIEYMNALPPSKLPISNTDGAIYRKQQLEKQLPVHDVDPNACHNLSDKEISEFGKYLQNLRNNVVGQGKIMKFNNNNIFRGESSLTDAVSTKESENTIIPYDVDGHGVLVRDKTAESKTIFSEKIDSKSYPADNTLKIDKVNHNKINSEYLPHHMNVLGKHKSKCDADNISNQSVDSPKNPTKMTDFTAGHLTLSDKTKQFDSAVQDHKTPTAGFKLHSPFSDNRNNNGNINFNAVADNDNFDKLNIGNDLRNLAENLTESPVNIDNINKKIISMDIVNNSTDFHKEPFRVNVMNASSYDLPFVPIQESLNIPIERETTEKRSSASHDKPLPLNVGKLPRSVEAKCFQCKETLQVNDVVVTTEREGDSSLWHARCFVCHICRELLVDLMYFYHEGKVYCGRDYAKARDIPRCFACDELIFVKEYTQAEGESYHLRHFCCYHCDEPLAGKRYIPKDNQPICLECYQNNYGKTCSSCLKPIPVSDQRVSIGAYNFHVTAKCFRCMNCSRFLKGERFILKNDKTFCSKECFLQYQK